jgi:hypothetical protein
MKYTVPIVEVNYNQEDLPLFYMYISLNVLQSTWFHIGVWASHKGDYYLPTPAISFSLLQELPPLCCMRYGSFGWHGQPQWVASMCFMSIRKQSTVIRGFCWVGICVVWLELCLLKLSVEFTSWCSPVWMTSFHQSWLRENNPPSFLVITSIYCWYTSMESLHQTAIFLTQKVMAHETCVQHTVNYVFIHC